MKPSTVLTRFARLSDSSLVILAGSIHSSMSGNANFTIPSPTLASLAAATLTYTTALSKAKDGSVVEKAIKKQAREILENLLNELALYVTQVSNADEAILLSSGFKISKQPAPVGPLPKPENFNVLPCGKGEIKLRIKAVYGASGYQWEYRQLTIPAAAWVININTKSAITLTGLESGKEYEFRVVPFGASDIREYSDVIRSFVL